VLAQTEGEETYVAPIPGFDIDTALCALNITRTPFDELNGNIQGFANGREIAANALIITIALQNGGCQQDAQSNRRRK
jgi:hypothetical protein